MDEDLRCKESRIQIFNKPLTCRFCSHDAFIPYSTYRNVEAPGIQCYYVNYTVVCSACGYTFYLSDASHPTQDGNYAWAFEQQLLHEPEHEAQIPVVRMLDEGTIELQKKCLSLIVQLLVQRKKIEPLALSTVQEEQYEQLHLLLSGQPVEQDVTYITDSCLKEAILKLMDHYVVANDQLVTVIQKESYLGLIPFLEQQLARQKNTTRAK